ncbi:MAG: desaturase [Myxococcaceae bacterium]|nr:desaturase [Myxococcaceae bacterium]
MSTVKHSRTSAAPTRHVYDVVVIGSHLGGAICAGLLQRRGLHVLYVEHDGTSQGYVHGGWLLPYAPFVLPALKACPSLEEALTELGLNTAYTRTTHLPQPMLQLALPHTRLDLSLDPKHRAKEAQRALGPESATFTKLWEDAASRLERTEPFFKEKPELPPEGMIATWSFKRVIGRHAAITEQLEVPKDGAAALLASLADFTVNVAERNALASTRPFSMLLQGVHSWPGGRDGLRELVLNRLSELGGDVLAHDASTVVEEIAFDGSRIAGIKLVKSDTIYKTSCVVGASDAAALRRLVPDKKKHRELAELLDGPTAKRVLFSVNWVVPESALPRGMGEMVLLAPRDTTLGPILVQVSPSRRAPGEPTAPEDDRTVCAGLFVDANLREQGEEQLQELADRVNVELDLLMPFTRQRARLVSAPYLHASGVRGSRLMPHPLLKLEDPALLGITGLPVKAPVKHLFLASREVLPGLGLEGEIIAALRAAKLIQETLKKSNPLAKQ